MGGTARFRLPTANITNCIIESQQKNIEISRRIFVAAIGRYVAAVCPPFAGNRRHKRLPSSQPPWANGYRCFRRLFSRVRPAFYPAPYSQSFEIGIIQCWLNLTPEIKNMPDEKADIVD